MQDLKLVNFMTSSVYGGNAYSIKTVTYNISGSFKNIKD